jgi:aryl-alcohol dehydrogenase-like predicted oxidoreductase
MKLALGTVQFGLPYGVANATGQVERAAVAAVLKHARQAGINTLDTAIAYGESEQRLGEAGVEGWRIVSKLPECPDTCTDAAVWVNDQVRGSLSRLGVTRLAGVLLHRPDQLSGPQGKALWAALLKLKQDGIVEKIGFSIYEPGELDVLWPDFRPDLVQAPYNALDRRLATSGWLQRMNSEGVEVHIRSVFLQGLLLMGENDRPKKFARWSALWAAWDTWLHQQGLSALQGCLGFAMADPNISRIIVGVDNLHQLKEILSSADAVIPQLAGIPDTSDPDLINPSRWNSL